MTPTSGAPPSGFEESRRGEGDDGDLEVVATSGPSERSAVRPPRIEVEGVVRLHCPERSGIHTGFLKNLSRGGIFLRILDPETPGTRVGFSFDLDGREVRGVGEVIWARRRYEGRGRPPGMAIRFELLDPESRRAVAATVGDDVDGDGDEERGSDEECIAGLVETPPDPESDLPAAPSTVASEEGRDPDRRGGDEEGMSREGGRTDVESDATGGRDRVDRQVGVAALLAAMLAFLLLVVFPRPEQESSRRVERSDRIESSRPSRPPGSDATAPAAIESPAGAAASSEQATEVSSPMGSETSAATSGPATAVEDIAVADDGQDVVLTLTGNGSFGSLRTSHSRIDGADSRIVVRLRGVSRPSQPDRWTFDHPAVVAVRSGYHEEEGVGELHLVADLADSDLEVVSIRSDGARLRLRLSPRDDG